MLELLISAMINQNIPRFERAFQLQDGVTKTTNTVFSVASQSDPRKLYYVNLLEHSCTCPDFTFRGVECKHIRAAQIKDGVI